jgi:adenylosuccinate synthase
MANVIIVGMQWGDEGKGKIVDLICPAFDAVVRFQGGHNAGHTVKFGDRHFSLHLIPSGILHPELRCVLGTGMVIAPDALLAELDRLRGAGVDERGRLFVAKRATALLPCHVALDVARERARGHAAIGTTARGIGPAYESKAGRYGVRMVDLLAPDLEARLAMMTTLVDAQLAGLGSPPGDGGEGGGPGDRLAALVEDCRRWGSELAPFLADAEQLLAGWRRAGDSLLFEGAQGALLDIDHGTYPYVTSSNSTTGGAATGDGVPPTALDGVIGVLKAYTTRVGGGPFTTELDDSTGEFLRQRGNEFGTTTGRPRRCGWLDTVAARYSQTLDGADVLALTKLDVLDELEEIKVCTAYRIGGAATGDFPADRRALEDARPLYRTLKGWRRTTVGVLDEADLPQAARDYVAFIEDELEVPVGLLSTGPRREETLLRDDPALDRLTAGRLGRVLAGRGV